MCLNSSILCYQFFMIISSQRFSCVFRSELFSEFRMVSFTYPSFSIFFLPVLFHHYILFLRWITYLVNDSKYTYFKVIFRYFYFLFHLEEIPFPNIDFDGYWFSISIWGFNLKTHFEWQPLILIFLYLPKSMSLTLSLCPGRKILCIFLLSGPQSS